ncbi:MAG: ribbon-helix-helix protein, CopG family [Candidatus Leucobacter sulfamidivorax]|nr:ribbon-helix-helix protein, CopG family [Candidatus Leucobacter sulfamidivorax]
MKTAISIPDDDFARFERIAAQHGMNRSEFYRRAAQRFCDELDGGSELTAIANATLDLAGQPADPLFTRESERLLHDEVDW